MKEYRTNQYKKYANSQISNARLIMLGYRTLKLKDTIAIRGLRTAVPLVRYNK